MGSELMEVKVMGIVVDPKASNPVVILADLAGKKALPIWIGVFEAEAISRGLEEVVTLRPMTHDLMKQILDTFRVSVTRVVIHDLKDNTFYANLYLSVDGRELIVDSRPSDAIALAVRYGVPIFVTDEVMREAAFVPQTEEEEKTTATPPSPEEKPKSKPKTSKVDQLQEQLDEAIKKEDYEKAAQLRDEIKKLQMRNS